MKAFYALFVVLITVSCGKEPLIPENSLIGTYKIVQVDSMLIVLSNEFFLLQSFPDSSTVHFNYDSTGRFDDPVRALSGSETDFRWAYNPTLNRLDLDFLNGVSNGLIEGELSDSIRMYIRCYLEPVRANDRRYYCLHMVKQ